MSTDMTTVKNQIVEISTRLQSMAEDIQTIKTMLERMDGRIRALENNDAAAHPLMESRLDAAWRTIDAHESKIQQLSQAVTELKHANRLLSWLGGVLGSTVLIWLVTQILQSIR